MNNKYITQTFISLLPQGGNQVEQQKRGNEQEWYAGEYREVEAHWTVGKIPAEDWDSSRGRLWQKYQFSHLLLGPRKAVLCSGVTGKCFG